VTHRGFAPVSLPTNISKSVLDSRCPTCGIWLASFHDTQVLAGAASVGVYFCALQSFVKFKIAISGSLTDSTGH
jgi:hypothetical protein